MLGCDERPIIMGALHPVRSIMDIVYNGQSDPILHHRERLTLDQRYPVY